MSTNNYSWNQKLKFSWGHIIAFLALIAITYLAYMGDFYSNGGDFVRTAIKICMMDLAILATFIGAQTLKGTNSNFDRSIIIERILICLAPIAFIWIMIPVNHYWSVYAEREQIEKMFSTSIEKSKTMFTDYNSYANNRIDNYSQHLASVINNKDTDYESYTNAGFSGNNDIIQKENYIQTLRLQLLSRNTDRLQAHALAWIESANQGASVWNAFLIGNIDKIADAIKYWNTTLADESEFKMSNEPHIIAPFSSEQDSYRQAVEGLQELKNTYTNTDDKKLTFNSIWSGILLFLMLLFPYVLQRRNTRATGLYYLIPFSFDNTETKTKSKNRQKKQSPEESEESEESERVEESEEEASDDTVEQKNKDNNDIYCGTF